MCSVYTYIYIYIYIYTYTYAFYIYISIYVYCIHTCIYTYMLLFMFISYTCIVSYRVCTCKYMFIHVAFPQAVDKWKREIADPAISRSGTGAGETLRLAVNGIPFTRGTKAQCLKRGITGAQDIDASNGSTDLEHANKFMRIHAAQSLVNLGIGRHGAVLQPGAASGNLMVQAQEIDLKMEIATAKDLNVMVHSIDDDSGKAAFSSDASELSGRVADSTSDRTCMHNM